MQLTDVQLKTLAADYRTARKAADAANATLADAAATLAGALGANGSVIIESSRYTASADATDLLVEPVRVIA